MLGAFAFANDLAFGLAEDDSLRSCIIASLIAERLNLPPSERAAVFYASLVKDAGCTSFTSPLAAFWQADEIIARRELVLFGGASSPAAFQDWMRRYVATDLPAESRSEAEEEVARKQAEVVREAFSTTREVAMRLAARLGMSREVIDGVCFAFEQWDGSGMPDGAAGITIPLAARVIHPTFTLAPVHTRSGREAAVEIARSQRGLAFDPEVADAFLDLAATKEFWDQLEQQDPWATVLGLEPPRSLHAQEVDVDEVVLALADFIDLKAPHIRAHSRRTAELAERLAMELGCTEQTVADARHAGLLHDLGLVAVPSATLRKREEQLSAADRERLRLHPYHGERILERLPPLQHLAAIVGAHHERFDGGGYYRGLQAPQIPLTARIVTVASRFDELTHAGPERAALSSEDALDTLTSEQRTAFAPDVVRALPAALGQHAALRRDSGWPAGLTNREVEVLRLASRELTRAAIARRLGVTENTVRHHLEHIYGKTGTGTRVGAVLFAMEHGLLD